MGIDKALTSSSTLHQYHQSHNIKEQQQLDAMPLTDSKKSSWTRCRHRIRLCNDWSRALGCLPLALVGLLVFWTEGVTFGALEIYRALAGGYWFDGISAGFFALGILKVVTGFIGCGVIVSRTRFFIEHLLKIHAVLAISIICSFALSWARFGIEVSNDEPITGLRIANVTVASVISVFVIVLMHWTLSVLTSLRMILRIGGTGWECESYLEIRILKMILENPPSYEGSSTPSDGRMFGGRRHKDDEHRSAATATSEPDFPPAINLPQSSVELSVTAM